MTTELAALAGAVIGVVVFVGGLLLGGWLRGTTIKNSAQPPAMWTGQMPKNVTPIAQSKSGAGARVDRQQTVFTMTEERERDLEDGRDRTDESDGEHD